MAPATFKLKDSFVAKYRGIKPPFGFNGLGELTYMRTYSRLKDDGKNEQWFETVRRVVEGTYRTQERHIRAQDLGWSDARAQKSAQEMYDRMFHMKFLPPGRGLWSMGTAIIEERGLWAAANNCAFVSTENIDKELSEPFSFLMDASMLGVGVGFDTSGAGKVFIHPQSVLNSGAIPKHHVEIADTREGWVNSVAALIDSYFVPHSLTVIFDYSLIREAGLPIRGFGGVSSGPEPLKRLHDAIRAILDPLTGHPITETAIVDLMNVIGVCVVSGNVRRSAEIVFGSPESAEYLSLKDYRWNANEGRYDGSNAHRADYGWTSNNSIFAEVGMDYSGVAKQTANNGEPGFLWLQNARDYGRMASPPDFKDKRAKGANPCSEQTLEDRELCCLVETFPTNHDNLDDYRRTLKFAYLYAKTVTLGKTHWPKTNRVLLRNRRIGASMSGIAQFVSKAGLHTLKQWCEEGYDTIQHYDKKYSEWLAVPRSVKTTSVKPSGTVSLLAGATPGIHFPESRFYIRRMRLSKHSDLIAPLEAAGFRLEPCVGAEDSTVVVEVPVSVGNDVRTLSEVTIWEQVALAAFMQKYWADNQVSVTVTFDPETESGQIEHTLDLFQYDLKGISYLPRLNSGAYAQMPYEAITEEQYAAATATLKPLELTTISGEEADVDKFCGTDKCQIDWGGPVA